MTSKTHLDKISRSRTRINLNKLSMPLKPNSDYSPHFVEDPSRRSENGEVEVMFRNIETRLIEFINESEVILGCVAWLTNKAVLNALSRRKAVSLVVQKEDFLRPDLNAQSGWAEELRAMYEALPGGLDTYSTGQDETLMAGVNDEFDRIAPVRCVGCCNVNHDPAFPRMHHKFIIACRAVTYSNDLFYPEPYAVWTGSFNFTANAARSLENALILRDKRICWAYYEEYAQISVLAEPLDWSTPWVSPEWFLGA